MEASTGIKMFLEPTLKGNNTRHWTALSGAGGGGTAPSAFPYPNAGLAAGRAGPLRRLWRALDLWPGEDDQAVLTDAALQLGPQRIVLDYGQVQGGGLKV